MINRSAVVRLSAFLFLPLFFSPVLDGAGGPISVVRTVEGVRGFKDARVHHDRYILTSTTAMPSTPVIYDIKEAKTVPFGDISSLGGLPEEPALPKGKERANARRALALKGQYFSWYRKELIYYDGPGGKAGLFLDRKELRKTVEGNPPCPFCSGSSRLVEQYMRFLCDSCRKYVPEEKYLTEVRVQYYGEVDLKSRSVKKLHEMKHDGFLPGEQEGVTPLGVDPRGRYLYYCNNVFFYKQVKTTGHILLYRMSLSTGTVDWNYEIKVPVREKGKAPLTYSIRHSASDDMSWIVFFEYDELASGNRGFLAGPGVTAWVVNTSSKSHFSVPGLLTCYGQVFDREGKYLYMGSNQTGEVVRVDLSKKAADLRVRGGRGVFKYALSPGGSSLYCFTKSGVEMRRVPDLGLVRTIPLSEVFPGVQTLLSAESLYVTGDGKHGAIGVLKKSANGPWWSSDFERGFMLLSIGD